jgi:UDPglucose 6-dehydrogenase
MGLTFKAGTSDVRDSPALTICADLARAGVQITGYDPRIASIDPLMTHTLPPRMPTPSWC